MSLTTRLDLPWLGQTSGARRKAVVTLSCVANLGLLGYFKYYNFFIDSLREAVSGLGLDINLTTLDMVLPVGISFYTFQTMSYTIDVYRGKLKPTRNFIDYAVYVSFFPQLVAGPIERGSALLPQFLQARSFDPAKARDGCRQILWGLLKKVVIADRIGYMVAIIHRTPPESQSGLALALATIFFAFQIYCDFSAYSDIAIGTGRLFGISLRRNFAYPYFSQSLTEFWRRWHISLSTWFRDYVYIPLGGSRTSRGRVVRNILVTFTLSGLWHGASWTFVVWGLLNGIGISLESWWRKNSLGPHEIPGGVGVLPSIRTLLRIVLVFTFVCCGWVFFWAANLEQAITVFSRIMIAPFESEQTRLTQYHLLGVGLIGVLTTVEWIQRDKPHGLCIEGLSRPIRWSIYTVLLWGGLYCRAPGTGPFIYFQF